MDIQKIVKEARMSGIPLGMVVGMGMKPIVDGTRELIRGHVAAGFAIIGIIVFSNLLLWLFVKNHWRKQDQNIRLISLKDNPR